MISEIERPPAINALIRAVSYSPDGIAVLAWSGEILYTNSTWADMHGYEASEMVGHLFQDLYPGEGMQRLAEEAVGLLENQEQYEAEIDHFKRDGTPFRAWLIVTLLRDEAGKPDGFLLTARDITEWDQLKWQLEQEKARLEQQYVRQRALASIELAINEPSELLLALEQVVAVTTELLPATGGATILLWDAKRETYSTSVSSVPGQQPSTAYKRLREKGGTTRWIIDSKRPFVVNDIRENPFEINPFMIEYGLNAFAGIPILSGNDCIGVLYAMDKDVRDYSPNDLDFLITLAARAGTAITKVQLYERLREANALLQNQTSDLAARNADLDAFAHSVAHDLKNPLASITGYTEFLLEDYDLLSEKERMEFLGYISKRGMKMRQIVDGLLMMSQLRNQEVQLSPVNMSLVVAEACNRLDDIWHQRDVTVHMPDSWPEVLGYAQWLEEVWTNYVSNAIKYGGLKPEIWLGATECSNGFVRFWIRDNGAGLTDNEQNQLFSPFTRLHRTEQEGHGLGLSIVQRIIGKCGGTVGVESTPGQGCTFWFTLPQKKTNQ